jgi:hypothetical protein
VGRQCTWAVWGLCARRLLFVGCLSSEEPAIIRRAYK